MRLRLLALLACTACSTYVEHRAALVPHAVPVQTLGQPNEWRTAVAVAAPNIADTQAPGVGDPNAGVAIPSRQLRGSFLLAVTRNFSLGVVREYGLASSAQPVKDTLPPLDDRPVAGSGTVFTYSIPTDSPWRVGVAVELIGWKVPWVEYSTCIDNCFGQPTTIITRDYSAVLTGALGIVPSYRLDQWIFFGGITARNHPTIREKVVSNGFSSKVEDGPLNVIAHAGVGFDATDRVRFAAEIHQTLTTDPVVYAPAIGLSLEVGLGPPMPKPRPPTTVFVPAPGMAPPGMAPIAPAGSSGEAVKLTQEAHAQAQAGECDKVRELDARVRALDPAYHATVFMRDALIAYCVTP